MLTNQYTRKLLNHIVLEASHLKDVLLAIWMDRSIAAQMRYRSGHDCYHEAYSELARDYSQYISVRSKYPYLSGKVMDWWLNHRLRTLDRKVEEGPLFILINRYLPISEAIVNYRISFLEPRKEIEAIINSL